MHMDTLERLQIIREIEELSIDYWHDADTNWGRNAHEYYTEDGSYTTSLQTRTGRAAHSRRHRDGSIRNAIPTWRRWRSSAWRKIRPGGMRRPGRWPKISGAGKPASR